MRRLEDLIACYAGRRGRRPAPDDSIPPGSEPAYTVGILYAGHEEREGGSERDAELKVDLSGADRDELRAS